MAQQNRNKKENTHDGQIVKFNKGNKYKFQVITQKGTVLKYRDGKLPFTKVLKADQIFGKTLRDIPSDSDLIKVFGTQDILKCAQQIVEKGELQYTKQERAQFIEDKKKQIANYIHENFINPTSKYPHPRQRILNCMKECKIRIDPDGDIMCQSIAAIQKMNGKLMFADAQSIIIRLKIKHSYYAKISNIISSSVTVSSADWNSYKDGCILIIQCTTNKWDDLQQKIYKGTNGGDYDFKDITHGSTEEKGQNDCNKGKGKRSKIKDQKQKPKMNGNQNKKKEKKTKDNYKKQRKEKNKFTYQY